MKLFGYLRLSGKQWEETLYLAALNMVSGDAGRKRPARAAHDGVS
jgi:hypothetical protein